MLRKEEEEEVKTPPMWMIEATGDKQLIKEMKELNKQKKRS